MSDQATQAIDYITQQAIASLNPTRILLFGSRARGDNRSTSDIDMAFDFPDESAEKWSRFAVEMDEEAPTLLEMDLVNLKTCDAHLRNEIIATGKVLYERKRA
jgi:predicted nucleotidyltransferase